MKPSPSALALWLALAPLALPAQDKENRMSEAIATVERALAGLPDRQLKDTPAPQLRNDAMRAAARLQWDGIALRVPELVDLATDASLPVLAAVSQTAQRGQAVPLGRHALVVTMGLDHFVRSAVPLFPAPAHKIPMPPRTEPPPRPDPPEPGETAAPRAQISGTKSFTTVDLRAANALPWAPGRYAVRVVVLDQASRTAQVRLAGGNAATPSDALPVLDTTPLKREAWAQRGRGEPNRLPNHLKLPNLSPSLGAPGVALGVPSKPQAAAGPVPVVGTVRLPVPGVAGSAAADNPLAAARGTLMLLRAGVQTPLLFDLELPLYPLPQAPGQAEGHFAVDLARLRGAPLAVADYQVWFMLAEHLAGPYRLQVQ